MLTKIAYKIVGFHISIFFYSVFHIFCSLFCDMYAIYRSQTRCTLYAAHLNPIYTIGDRFEKYFQAELHIAILCTMYEIWARRCIQCILDAICNCSFVEYFFFLIFFFCNRWWRKSESLIVICLVWDIHLKMQRCILYMHLHKMTLNVQCCNGAMM